MPHLIIIAGPNGSGKTNTAPALLNKALNVAAFVNADTIAQGLLLILGKFTIIQTRKS